MRRIASHVMAAGIDGRTLRTSKEWNSLQIEFRCSVERTNTQSAEAATEDESKLDRRKMISNFCNKLHFFAFSGEVLSFANKL